VGTSGGADVPPDRSSRQIPPFDRERERIAVRYNQKQRRLRYGGEPLPQEPEVDAVFLAFSEVVGRIAYRRLSALEATLRAPSNFSSDGM
jgi:hypothetical protein